MKLRKIEISGFKSFYDKTVFDFTDGITAIVGPNGCGKSNVVDAIRWVLGEHAPSHLRSSALEDVIFKGSEAAGPLGMAEVTITFSNEDGQAPPGYESFSEIQITRRAYRGGDSEFAINKVPCRLKDIVELFLDTGAGARGYSIIEQGRISRLIESKPEEKRLMVEEVAGVAKFRVRRKEAERKMDNTRQNLARVSDILREVETNIARLERQVKKAEKYKVMRDELRDLDFRVASRKHRDMVAALSGAQETLGRLEVDLVSARTVMAEAETGRESERIRLAEIGASVQTLRSELATLLETTSSQESEWKAKRAESEQLAERIREADAEIVVLGDEISETERKLVEEAEASDRRVVELVAAEAAMATAKTDAEVARSEYQAARSGADGAQSDLMNRLQMHSNATTNAATLRRALEDSARQIARQAEKTTEAEGACDRASSECVSAEGAVARAGESLAAAVASWESAGQLWSETVARLESVVSEHRDAEKRLQSVVSRRDTLSRIHERKDWASAGAKAVLRRGGGGILGLVGDLVETEARFEKAVEAVLGDRLHSVVVSSSSDALSAIAELRASKEGRGTFLPLALKGGLSTIDLTGESGVIARLSDVVSSPVGGGEVASRLFAGVFVVDTIDTALRLFESSNGDVGFVTPDGDVLSASGAISGGTVREGESGILAVKREIRELDHESAELSAVVAAKTKEEGDLRSRKIECELARDAAFRDRETRKSELSSAESRAAAAREGLDRAKRHAESLLVERDFLQGEVSRMSSELESSEVLARDSEMARGEGEERLASLKERAESARLRFDEAQRAAHEAEVALTSLKGRHESDEARRKALADSVDSRRRSVEERRGRREAHVNRIDILVREIADGRTSIDASLARVAEMYKVIEERDVSYNELSSKIDALDAHIRDERRREGSLQDAVAGSRLTAQRMEMEIGNLDNITWSRYEIRPADIVVEESPSPADGADPLPDWEARAEEIRGRINSFGDVNLGALEEHREYTERRDFLSKERADLEAAIDDLVKAIQKINRTTRERVLETLDQINARLVDMFPRFFPGGGRAALILVDEENILESGIEFSCKLPGKAELPLRQLSGGERSMAAAALILTMFLVKPSPFCLLDEADAALDGGNTDRLNAVIRHMSSRFQFLLITHNKRTMELADYLYGVTMPRPGISKVVSVRFDSSPKESPVLAAGC